MRRAFSLMECLVVVAIIALVAAILFPVFASAKKQARATSCLSNLRQLGLAAQMYQADANGLLPSGDVYRYRNTMGDGSLSEEHVLRDVIKPLYRYAGGDAALKCPVTDNPFLPRWVRSFQKPVDESRLMIPDPMNVLAECHHHLLKGWIGGPGYETYWGKPEREGFHFALHVDGSVVKDNAKSVLYYRYQRVRGQDVWTAMAEDDGAFEQRSYEVFPEEPWPPQWIVLPENVLLNWGRGDQ